MPSNRFPVTIGLLLALAVTSGCAKRTAPVALAPPAPPPAKAPVAMPSGAYAGMPIPARLADGSYDTPNRALSPAAAVWHLRAGLNVAALACRGAGDAVLVARYNALLSRQKPALRDAEAATAGEYRDRGGAAWREQYDGAMTVLYNFFSQGFAHDAFCTAATRVLAESETISPTDFPAFAAARLPALDGAFTDFYARYDSWRAGSVPAAAPGPPPIVAVVQPAPIKVVERPAPVLATVPKREQPWIELENVALLADPSGQEVRATIPKRELASAQPSR